MLDGRRSRPSTNAETNPRCAPCAPRASSPDTTSSPSASPMKSLLRDQRVNHHRHVRGPGFLSHHGLCHRPGRARAHRAVPHTQLASSHRRSFRSCRPQDRRSPCAATPSPYFARSLPRAYLPDPHRSAHGPPKVLVCQGRRPSGLASPKVPARHRSSTTHHPAGPLAAS